MSEFSQSYHLVADEQADAGTLLERAGLTGWVFPPGNGWVTLLPEADEFGSPLAPLAEANTGTLLYYVNAEDHGWTFTIYQGAEIACAYGCSWDDALEIEDAKLDMAVIDHIVQANALEPATSEAQIRALLYPGSLEALAAYWKHTDMRNPGHGFSEAIGLEYFHWLSSHYVTKDGGAVDGVDLLRVE